MRGHPLIREHFHVSNLSNVLLNLNHMTYQFIGCKYAILVDLYIIVKTCVKNNFKKKVNCYVDIHVILV